MEEEAAVCLSWAALAFRWQNKTAFAGWAPVVLHCHLLMPPAQPLVPNPGPSSAGRQGDHQGCALPLPFFQRLALLPTPSQWPVHRRHRAGEQSCWGSSEKTCGFILRTHNAAPLLHPARRNWAARCLVMLGGCGLTPRI